MECILQATPTITFNHLNNAIVVRGQGGYQTATENRYFADPVRDNVLYSFKSK
jgi:hypothetical protein